LSVCTVWTQEDSILGFEMRLFKDGLSVHALAPTTGKRERVSFLQTVIVVVLGEYMVDDL